MPGNDVIPFIYKYADLFENNGLARIQKIVPGFCTIMEKSQGADKILPPLFCTIVESYQEIVQSWKNLG